MPDLTMRIRQYSFTLAPRYSAGTVLTAGEAQALNGLMVENIRNNVDQWVASEVAALPAGTLLPAETITALQRRISDYQQQYQFNERRGAGRPRAGAIELEARQLALMRISEREGIVVGDISVEQFASSIDELLEDPSLQAEARDRVAIREAAVQRSLDDL
jgi:hypothetical protein